MHVLGNENKCRSLSEIDDRKGHIRHGYDADLLLIDEDLKLHSVIKNGSLV